LSMGFWNKRTTGYVKSVRCFPDNSSILHSIYLTNYSIIIIRAISRPEGIGSSYTYNFRRGDHLVKPGIYFVNFPLQLNRQMNCPGYFYVKQISLTSPPVDLIVGIRSNRLLSLLPDCN
jgi:hypothetical protein